MRQELEEAHESDEEGNPAGGRTTGRGIDIQWQKGPLGPAGERQVPNGAFVEGVIQAALGRLEFYQGTKFKCRENTIAIIKLEDALAALERRTQDREKRGVEGTHEV